jgi:hypothetical protein
MLGNQLLNSIPRSEEDLNRLKGWTSCILLVKPVKGGRWTTRARSLASPRPWAWAWARRGRTWRAGAVSCFLSFLSLARAGFRNLRSPKVLHGTRAIRFLGSVLTRLLAPWTTNSSASWWPFVGLHCEALPASISFGYFRQGQLNSISIPAGNGATGASGTGPALGYTLNV